MNRFRFLRKSWDEKSPWVLSPAISDEEAVANGYVLAGQVRDSSALTPLERVELDLLLRQKKRRKSDHIRVAELLGRVGFAHRVGIIDFDVNTQSRDYDPETSRKKSLEFARKFAYFASERGFGNLNWYSSGHAGGFHADLILPEDLADPLLLEAIKLMVVRLADELGIPRYLSFTGAQKQDKSKRPAVYLDDSVLNKNPQARGGLWRLPGTSKPGGKPKTLIDILAPGCPEIPSNPSWTPLDRVTILASLEIVKAIHAQDQAAPKTDLTDKDIDLSSGPLSEEDIKFLDSHDELLSIWNKLDRNGSRKDYTFARYAWFYGADFSQIIRLLKAMPGGKGRRDKRNDAYFLSIINSIRRCPLMGVGKYSGYLRPLELTAEQRHIMYDAAALSPYTSARNNMLSALMCGQLVQQSVCNATGLLITSVESRCERPTCPRCEPIRAYLQLQAVMKTWPRKVSVISMKLEDDRVGTPQRALIEWKASVRRTLGREADRVLSKIRTVRAPGELLIIHPSRKVAQRYEFLGARVLSTEECIAELKRVLYIRPARLMGYLKRGDIEGLSLDPWAGKVVSVRGSKEAKTRLPWLSKKDIRRDAKRQAEAVRGETKVEDLTFHVIRNTTGEIISSRKERPFNRHELANIYITKTPQLRDRMYQKPPD